MNLKNLKKNFSIILFPLFILAVALIAKVYVTSGEKNNIVYMQERLQPGYEPAPAAYKVSPSRSKAWALASRSEGGRVWRFIAIITFWLLIALLTLVIMDEAPVTLTARHLSMISAGLLIIWAAGNFAAYLLVLENNWVNISPELYNILKDLPGGFDNLFDSKEIIR